MFVNELQVIVSADGRLRIGARSASAQSGFFVHFARGRLVQEAPASLHKAASNGWAVAELDVRERVAPCDVSAEVEAMLEVAAELVAAAMHKMNGG